MPVNLCDYCHEPITFRNTACLCYGPDDDDDGDFDSDLDDPDCPVVVDPSKEPTDTEPTIADPMGEPVG